MIGKNNKLYKTLYVYVLLDILMMAFLKIVKYVNFNVVSVMVKIIIAPYVKEIELILLFVIAKMEHMMMESLLIANCVN